MVLTTRGFTTGGSFNQGSYSWGFLEAGVLRPGLGVCDVDFRLETTGAAIKIAGGTTDNQ